MGSPSIGLATPADIHGLCDLLALLFSQEAEFSPARTAQGREPAVGHILVARQDA